MAIKNLLKTIFPFFLLFALLISCSKTSTPTAGNPRNPKLLIVNASPNSSQLGLSVNSGIIFSNLAYTKTNGYFQLGQGDYSMEFFRTDTATTYLLDTIIGPNNDTTYKRTDSVLYRITKMVTLDTAKITVKPDSAYSLFLIDSASKLKHFFVTDYLTDSGIGSTKIRFFNFSPSAPAVDLAISGNIVFSNRSFNDVGINKSFATFSQQNAGNFDVTIRLTGTTTIVGTLTGVMFTQGKHYTIYAKGFYGGTGTQALGLGIIANN